MVGPLYVLLFLLLWLATLSLLRSVPESGVKIMTICKFGQVMLNYVERNYWLFTKLVCNAIRFLVVVDGRWNDVQLGLAGCFFNGIRCF